MSRQVTPHFQEHEIMCRCGCGGTPTKAFMDKLEALRVACDFPFRMSSVARCATHNENIGGARQSDHIIRKNRNEKDERGAGDIKLDEFSYERRYKVVMEAGKLGFDVIEICDAHIHVGIRRLKDGILLTGKSK